MYNRVPRSSYLHTFAQYVDQLIQIALLVARPLRAHCPRATSGGFGSQSRTILLCTPLNVHYTATHKVHCTRMTVSALRSRRDHSAFSVSRCAAQLREQTYSHDRVAVTWEAMLPFNRRLPCTDPAAGHHACLMHDKDFVRKRDCKHIMRGIHVIERGSCIPS